MTIHNSSLFFRINPLQSMLDYISEIQLSKQLKKEIFMSMAVFWYAEHLHIPSSLRYKLTESRRKKEQQNQSYTFNFLTLRMVSGLKECFLLQNIEGFSLSALVYSAVVMVELLLYLVYRMLLWTRPILTWGVLPCFLMMTIMSHFHNQWNRREI